MIKFKVSEIEKPVVDFDNTSTGIVVEAEPSDVRRWKMVMTQFAAVQEEMTQALNDSLKVTEFVVHDSETRPGFPKSGVEVLPDPPSFTPQATAQLLGAPPELPQVMPGGSKVNMPVERAQPSTVQRNGMMVQSVTVPQDSNGGAESVSYNSAAYAGTGRLNMDLPTQATDMPVKRGPGRPRKNP